MNPGSSANHVRPGSVSWRLLRPETVSTDGGPIEVRPRPRAVLIRLLLAPNQTVSTDEIADFIWGEDLPKTPGNSIARFVADLRRALGPWQGRIVTSTGGYQVVVHPGELDVELARAALDDATRLAIIDPEEAHSSLVRGLELVGDGPNPVIVTLPDPVAILRAHDEIRIATLELLAEVSLGRGHVWDLVSMLEKATTTYPFHERFWTQLMTALDRSGRKVEALRIGQRARETLAEAGIEPSSWFRSIEAAIAADEPALPENRVVNGPAVDGGPRALAMHGINAATSTLFGRVAELNELELAIEQHRVVSIVGLGGSGKTRVAIALLQPLEALGTTVYRVGLRSARDPELVVPTVAAVLGVPTGGASDAIALARAVSNDSFVLLLDNCEHVRASCAELVDALGELAPDVRVLTTTREALGVSDERVFSLGMLALPASGEVSDRHAAVSLLIDRAEIHLGLSGVTEGSLRHLCTIARALAGHPLAIEMAAAQLAHSTPALLSERIGDLFNSDPNDRTIGALLGIMDWTWEQLDPEQQQLLARLSVFGGGWTIGAAEAVCVERRSLRVDLDALMRRGLIASTAVQGRERFEMLEPVRSYAAERLMDRHEANALSDRLVGWLVSLAGRWSVAEHHVWAAPSSTLLAEHVNFVTALGYLRDAHRLEDLAQLAIGASGMWINHGFAEEVKRWLSPIVEAPSLAEETRSAAAAMLLAASHALGELDKLTPLGLRCLELAAGKPYDWVPAVASFLSLWVLLDPGAPGAPTSDQLHETSVTAALGSPSRETNLAVAALYQAHVRFSLRAFEESAALFADVRSSTQQAGRLLLVAELGHGLSLLMAQQYDEARESVAGWKSRWDTDDWHYMVAVVGAVILGGCGAPAEATAELAAAVRRLRPATIWGRADEIQTAFGLLAGFRGEDGLSDKLLSTAATRDVLLLVATVELVARRRAATDDARWFEVAQEFWTRVMPEQGGRGAASTAPELLSWWSTAAG